VTGGTLYQSMNNYIDCGGSVTATVELVQIRVHNKLPTRH